MQIWWLKIEFPCWSIDETSRSQHILPFVFQHHRFDGRVRELVGYSYSLFYRNIRFLRFSFLSRKIAFTIIIICLGFSIFIFTFFSKLGFSEWVNMQDIMAIISMLISSLRIMKFQILLSNITCHKEKLDSLKNLLFWSKRRAWFLELNQKNLLGITWWINGKSMYFLNYSIWWIMDKAW